MTTPKIKHMPPKMSVGEEIANSVTHGVGALLSLAGMVILIVRAAMYGTAIHVVSFAIYGTSLFDVVSWASCTTRQTRVLGIRPRRHLPTDCWFVHAVLADLAVGSVGIDADDRGLDASDSGRPVQEPVYRSVP